MARVSPRNGNGRCPFVAKWTHESSGVTLKLCLQHYRVLKHRGHLAGDGELVKRWLAD